MRGKRWGSLQVNLSALEDLIRHWSNQQVNKRGNRWGQLQEVNRSVLENLSLALLQDAVMVNLLLHRNCYIRLPDYIDPILFHLYCRSRHCTLHSCQIQWIQHCVDMLHSSPCSSAPPVNHRKPLLQDFYSCLHLHLHCFRSTRIALCRPHFQQVLRLVRNVFQSINTILIIILCAMY